MRPNSYGFLWVFFLVAAGGLSAAVDPLRIEGGAPDWAGFQGGPERLGAYPGRLETPVKLVWRMEWKPSAVSPIVAEGTVYLADPSGGLAAVDGATGKPLWSVPMEGAVETAPAYAQGAVFAGTAAGNVYSVSTSGKILWARRLDGPASSMAAAAGLVIFGVGRPGEKLAAFRASDGKTVWMSKLKGAVTGAPAVRGGRVAVVTGAGLAVVLDLKTGKMLWERAFLEGEFFRSAPAFSGNALFAAPGGYDRAIHSLEAGTGRALSGGYQIPRGVAAPVKIFRDMQRARPERRNGILAAILESRPALAKAYSTGFIPFGKLGVSSPASTGDALYLTHREEGYPGPRMALRAYDRRKGRLLWERAAVGPVQDLTGFCPSPVVWGDLAIAELGEGRLLGLDRRTGDIRFSQPLDAPLDASPALYDNTVYVLTRRGTLFAFQGAGSAFSPAEFSVSQNHPNPFNPATTIAFAIPEKAEVRLEVFDLLGRRVALLAEGVRRPGFYSARWEGKTVRGLPASSGVYVYRLAAGPFVKTHRMTLLK